MLPLCFALEDAPLCFLLYKLLFIYPFIMISYNIIINNYIYNKMLYYKYIYLLHAQMRAAVYLVYSWDAQGERGERRLTFFVLNGLF